MIQGLPYEVVNNVPFTAWKGPKGSKLLLVNTKQEWDAFFELLMERKLVAVDTETSGFDYWKDDHIVGMSFGWLDLHFYIPVRHVDSLLGGEQPVQLAMEDLLPDLKKFFAQDDVFIVLHNAKFDFAFFIKEGIEILTPFHDTSILWQFHDENAPSALKVIASGWTDLMGRKHKGLVGPEAAAKEKELDNWRGAEAKARRDHYRKLVLTMADDLREEVQHQNKTRPVLKNWIMENLLHEHPYKGAAKEDIHYGYVPISLMTEYAATDTFLTYELYTFLMSQVTFTDKRMELYINEIKLSDALSSIERGGILADRGYLQVLSVELAKEIEDMECKIKLQLGDINLNSTDQLAAAFTSLGMKLTKTTDSGKLALDAGVLEKLAKEHEIASEILKLREINKIKNTYVDGILEKLTPEDMLHCSFRQNVSTGRMSSASPNLQNIPRGDNRIRKAFITPEDYIYVFADYSQIEVRLTAHFSGDPLLLDAYKKNQDVHTRTMCEMFGKQYDYAVEVLGNQDHPEYKEFYGLRSIAKTINFGIIYGVGAPGLSEQIPRPDQYKDISHEEWVGVCQSFIDQYLRKYIGVKRMVNACSRTARRECEITNHFGRVRHLPHAQADKILGRQKGNWMVGRAERQATNFLIQSAAADLFKVATVRVHDLLAGTRSRTVNLVHDEIQAYIHKEELDLLPKWKEAMEDFDFAVPIVADFGYSTTSWADKRELKV